MTNGLAAVGATLPAYAGASGQHVPTDIGRKFHADGTVRPFAGNTIIAHLPQQGAGYPSFDQVLDIYRELPRLRFARKLAALPPSSYHMTIFGAANDQDRRRGLWPADLSPDAPMEECNALLLKRFESIRLQGELPFRMVIDDRVPPSKTSAIGLHLRPVDSAEAAKLGAYRDKVADAFRIRSADHDRYQFHITLAYQIAPFNAQDESEFAHAMNRWRSKLAASVPIFEFGAPEFCVLRDMFGFRSLATAKP